MGEKIFLETQNNKLSLTNRLQLIIILLLIISIATNQTKPAPKNTFVVNPRHTVRINLLEGWKTLKVRNSELVIQREAKDEEPTTTIVVYDQQCSEQNCLRTDIPTYEELKNTFTDNHKFKMNSERVYMLEGKEYSWFSFRITKELFSNPVFEGFYLPEIIPNKPLFTFVNVQQGMTLVTAVIITDALYTYHQFEAEEMIKKLEILNSNYLNIWD